MDSISCKECKKCLFINTLQLIIQSSTKYKNWQGEKKLAGTAYEDIEESYYDILGIVEYALNLGYTSIYLQGHSLGATKVVFSYMKMIEEDVKEVNNIKGIILLFFLSG